MPMLQPHEGSSETRNHGHVNALVRVLQPHEGSSETSGIETEQMELSRLQPHEGSSETQSMSASAAFVGGFNPTRVRLKQSRGPRGRDSVCQRGASTPRGFV